MSVFVHKMESKFYEKAMMESFLMYVPVTTTKRLINTLMLEATTKVATKFYLTTDLVKSSLNIF